MPHEVVEEGMEIKDRSSLDQARAEFEMLNGSMENISHKGNVDVSGEELSPVDYARLLDVLEGRIPRMNVAKSVQLPLLVRDDNGGYVIRIEVFNFGGKEIEQFRKYFAEIQDMVATFNGNIELRGKFSYVYELLKLLYVYLDGVLQPVQQRQGKLAHDTEKAIASLGIMKIISTNSHYEFCRDEEFEKSIAGQFEKFKERASENGVTEPLTLNDVRTAFYSGKMLRYSFLNDERGEFYERVKARRTKDTEKMGPGIKSFFYMLQHGVGLDQWGGGGEMVRSTLVGMGEEMQAIREEAAFEVARVLQEGARAVADRREKTEGDYIDLGSVETTPPLSPKAPKPAEHTRKKDALHDIFDIDAYEREKAEEAERISQIDVYLRDEDAVDVAEIPEVPLEEIEEEAPTVIEEPAAKEYTAERPRKDDDDAPLIVVNREIEVPDEVYSDDVPRLSMDYVMDAREVTDDEAQAVLREEALVRARTGELIGAIKRMTNFGFQLTEEQADFIYSICFKTDEESLALRLEAINERQELARRYGFDCAGCGLRYVSIKLGLLIRAVRAFTNDSKIGPEEDDQLKAEIYRILMRDQSEG